MALKLVWSQSLRNMRGNATVAPVKSFGAVCREIRVAGGLSQKEVADAGGLDQSRVSEIERGRYLPGLDMAMRLANGLGVTLTSIVAQWEGSRAAEPSEGPSKRSTRRKIPAVRFEVPQEDVFRKVRGLWELMSPEHREEFWKQGKAIVAAQWRHELRGEFPRAVEPPSKPRPRKGRAG